MAQTLKIPEWLKETRRAGGPGDGGGGGGGGYRGPGFLEKNLAHVASTVRWLMDSDDSASRPGLLQGLDSRARIAGIFIILVAAAMSETTVELAGIIILTALLTVSSRVRFVTLAKRILPAFVFTTVITIPVFFGFFSPGPPGTPIVGFSVLSLEVSMTTEGLSTGAFFITRVSAMVALAALLVLTTRQTDFFRGLRRLLVPGFFVTALFMTFRYIFILLKLFEDATLARKSRTITRPAIGSSQRWFASRIALFLKKSLAMAEEVGMAMASRGFSGRIRTVGGGSLKGKDYLWVGTSVFVLFLSLGF
ncbi:MAG TPA: cobalt ECF transporter T component CbiQ [Thermodesulfobacteriota bacterium]|nr:cobalt ECF transporter T component CbiQ [Thermodesulfobacteriota bacterium]